MFPVSQRRAAQGFSLIEIMIAVAVLGVMLAVGVPAMSRWIDATKARSALEFYAEGLALARQQAIGHNGASRFVLTANAANGQNDWQVDICFPTALLPCDDVGGGWSTVSAPATGDPEGTKGFLSVRKSAATLPKASVMATTLTPLGSSAIYFNSVGWVDTTYDERLTSIRFAPASGYEKDIRPAAIVVSLAGTATKCDPSVAAPDSRACP